MYFFCVFLVLYCFCVLLVLYPSLPPSYIVLPFPRPLPLSPSPHALPPQVKRQIMNMAAKLNLAYPSDGKIEQLFKYTLDMAK
jgi:hypothetical protein